MAMKLRSHTAPPLVCRSGNRSKYWLNIDNILRAYSYRCVGYAPVIYNVDIARNAAFIARCYATSRPCTNEPLSLSLIRRRWRARGIGWRTGLCVFWAYLLYSFSLRREWEGCMQLSIWIGRESYVSYRICIFVTLMLPQGPREFATGCIAY